MLITVFAIVAWVVSRQRRHYCNDSVYDVTMAAFITFALKWKNSMEVC